MLKLPKKLAILLILFVLSLVPVTSVFAKTPVKSRTVLARGETVTNDYFAAGDKVVISGIVTGDAYVAGGNVFVDGVVRGDLLVAAGKVIIEGGVGQDVRVIGGTVEVKGRVGRNISVLAGTVEIGNQAVIGGNVNGAFGQLTYLGQAMGDLNLAGGTIEIDGRNDGNVYLRGDTIALGENAQLFGNLTYESKKEAEIAEGTRIYGATLYKPVNQNLFGSGWGQAKGGMGVVQKGFSLVGLMVAFLIGFVLLRIFPRRMLHMNVIMAESPFKSLLVGLLLVMVTPLMVFLLSITIIGIPLAIVWMFGLAISLYFAKIWIGFWLGSAILRRFKQSNRRGWALLTGLVVYFILRELPFVGWLFSLLTAFAGIGLIVREKVYLYRRITARKLL